MDHGKDGYYREWAERQQEGHEEQQRQEEREQ